MKKERFLAETNLTMPNDRILLALDAGYMNWSRLARVKDEVQVQEDRS